jgi:hypothetical protein
MADVDDRMLERVRKLLARAEHPSTPLAEAEACSEKAAELMSRHLIDEAMLDAERLVRSAPVVRAITVDAPYALAKAVLVDAVARAFRVCVAIGGELDSGGKRCTLVGFEADIAMTELLVTSLLLQASTAMIAQSRGRPDVKSFRRAFLFGYADMIGARLRRVRGESEEEAASATPGSAVVLASREVEVRSAFEAQFPRLRSLRATTTSGSGLAAGRVAGARADLSATQRRLRHDRRALGA